MTASLRLLAAAAVAAAVLVPAQPARTSAPAPQAQAGQASLLDQMRSDAKTAMSAAAAAGRGGDALDTYDRFYASVRKHDPALLSIAAKAVLAEASQDPASLARIPALERLARAGDAKSRGQLDASAGGRNTLMPSGIEADCALARLGEGTAIDRLVQRLGDDTLRDKGIVIGCLSETGAARTAYAIVPFLQDDNPTNKLSAVQALARLGARDQVAPLRAAFEAERHPGMRQTMAMALHALGSTAGDAVLAEVAASRIPDVRLTALEAYYAAKSPAWKGMATQMLTSASEGARLRAAVMLGPDNAAAVREIAQAATSSNVATREVGARLLESAGSRDLALLLTLLRDTSPLVRVYAGGAVLAGAR